MNATGMLAVGIGAAVGAWTRWALAIVLNPLLPYLPLGTLAANLVGGYLIGVAVAVLGAHAALPPEIRLFVVTGFLGALTTFSTFSAEVVDLLERHHYGWVATLVASHVLGSVLAVIAGIGTIRVLSSG